MRPRASVAALLEHGVWAPPGRRTRPSPSDAAPRASGCELGPPGVDPFDARLNPRSHGGLPGLDTVDASGCACGGCGGPDAGLGFVGAAGGDGGNPIGGGCGAKGWGSDAIGGGAVGSGVAAFGCDCLGDTGGGGNHGDGCGCGGSGCARAGGARPTRDGGPPASGDPWEGPWVPPSFAAPGEGGEEPNCTGKCGPESVQEEGGEEQQCAEGCECWEGDCVDPATIIRVEVVDEAPDGPPGGESPWGPHVPWAWVMQRFGHTGGSGGGGTGAGTSGDDDDGSGDDEGDDPDHSDQGREHCGGSAWRPWTLPDPDWTTAYDDVPDEFCSHRSVRVPIPGTDNDCWFCGRLWEGDPETGEGVETGELCNCVRGECFGALDRLLQWRASWNQG